MDKKFPTVPTMLLNKYHFTNYYLFKPKTKLFSLLQNYDQNDYLLLMINAQNICNSFLMSPAIKNVLN